MASKDPELSLDVLRLEKMASKHLCLVLSEQVSWEEFPQYATKLLKLIGGSKLGGADGPDIRLWNVDVDGVQVRLVFDDYPLGVSLESSSDEGDELMRRLAEQIHTSSS